MIQANHKRWARFLYEKWVERQLRNCFDHFYLTKALPPIKDNTSILITPNHMSWWDGFIIDYLCRRLVHKRFHIMMLEQQLRRYWFFQKLGAYSISTDTEASIDESLYYTSRILSNPDNLVVIFPQGILEPYDKRPLLIKRYGLSRLAAITAEPITIIPLAIKISYYTCQKPDIIARFGEPVTQSLLINNFNGFIDLFRENIDLLDESSFKRSFSTDLFS